MGAILELSGYDVYPYGYETLLPALRTHFRKNQSSTRSPTEERLRSTPDLLVSDPEAQRDESNTQLVEVKFRNCNTPKKVGLWGIRWYQRYWPDAVLVLVVPGGDFFYAQAVDKLDDGKSKFDLTQDFLPLSEWFKRIRLETMALFQEDTKQFAHMVVRQGMP